MATWPKISVDTKKSIDMCFGCGRNNPIGLKLNFTWDSKITKAEFTPSKLHQGWPGIVHGGIITCLLDEAMSYAPYFKGIKTTTAKMQVRIRRPALVGEPLIITSSITKKNRKLVQGKAAISLKDGTPIAESTATMFILNSELEDTNQETAKPNGDVQKQV